MDAMGGSDGFLNVLKPPGMSSHDVVNDVRRIFGTRKAGHAGTLDPGAAGVLPVAVGKALRLLEYLSAAGKSYRAELRFGMATDSGDDLGKPLEERQDFCVPGEEAIREAMRELTGEIRQRPPAYSAVKYHGRKAYALARQDMAVELPERAVHVYRFDLLERRERTLLLDIDCSKGTYIRVLCADLGKRLGIPAAMSFLVRTRVGDFCLPEARTLEEVAALGEQALIPPDACLSHLPRYELAERREKAFCCGLPTTDRAGQPDWHLLRVYCKGRFLGIGRFAQGEQAIFPEKVFLSEGTSR